MSKYNIKHSPEAIEARREKFFRLGSMLRSKHTCTQLYLDGILTSAFKEFHIDIMKLEKQIPNYDWEKCTYKGKPNYSIKKATKKEWGGKISQLIQDLI